MRKPDRPKAGVIFRCAIYTRKSSDDGLEQEFNSLDAQSAWTPKRARYWRTPRKAHTPTERELDGRIVVQTSNRQGSGRPADLTAISLAKALLGRAGGEGWTPSMATVRAAAR